MENSTEIMTHSPTINCQNFEQIFIKEEPLEENPGDYELYENVLQSVKKEECITDDDNQIDKACDKRITINNDIRKTENINSNKFCCEVCNKSFTWPSLLTRHLKIHKDKEFECGTCKKMCNTKENLQRHMTTVHTSEGQYQCPTCDKLFTQNSSLKTHMKIHSGKKDHKCTICNKQFTYYSALYIHMKIHTNTRTHKCPTCNKSFITSSHLKVHMRIHSGIRDYKCEICNKLFIHIRSLQRHSKIHNKSN